MAAPTLSDYQYMFKDNGLLLNGPANLPFFDVERVTGLDMPAADPKQVDIDNQDGGFMYAKYVDMRTLVIEGTAYAVPSLADIYIDKLVSNFMLDNEEYKFYFKGSGISQRYILCKSLGIRYDLENLRNYGATAAQITLIASDPRKYVDNPPITMAPSQQRVPDNTGNRNSYPIFDIVGAYTNISLTNVSQNRTVTITATTGAADLTTVDFMNRTVKINGVNRSASVTSRAWWDIPAGNTNNIRYTVSGGSPVVTMYTRQAWL